MKLCGVAEQRPEHVVSRLELNRLRERVADDLRHVLEQMRAASARALFDAAGKGEDLLDHVRTTPRARLQNGKHRRACSSTTLVLRTSTDIMIGERTCFNRARCRPANVPMLSMRWVRRNCASIFFWSVTSVLTIGCTALAVIAGDQRPAALDRQLVVAAMNEAVVVVPFAVLQGEGLGPLEISVLAHDDLFDPLAV